MTLGGVSLMISKLAKAGVKLSVKQLRKGFGSRHANSSTTMDLYANVNAAAEEAVLGPRRNSSGNTEAGSTHDASTPDGATPATGTHLD